MTDTKNQTEVLFHAELAEREFGSALLSVAKLSAWAHDKDIELVTVPPLAGYRFVQVEALLCAIERGANNLTPEQAAKIVQADPVLSTHGAATDPDGYIDPITCRWLLGADAHISWRRLLESAIQKSELTLLNFASKLPIDKPQAAPVVTAPANSLLPVTTGDVAHAFDGLRNWDEKAWKDTLGSPPNWLRACIVIPGRRGINETRWNPVLIGAALVNNGHAKPNNIRAKFQTAHQLKPWLDAWKTYEADYLPTE